MNRRFNLRTFFWIVACAAAIAWLVSPPQRSDWLPDGPGYRFRVLDQYGVEYVVRCLVALPFRLAVLSGVYAAFMLCKKLATKNSPTAK